MANVIKAVAGSRPARPLLIWALSMLVYLVFPLPRWWLLLLIVGLGVALTVTVIRVRDIVVDAEYEEPHGWQPATPNYHIGLPFPPVDQAQTMYGQVSSPTIACDPGALLSAVVAVLAAEGLPADAAPGLPAVAQLLADLGIQPQPGIPAPTARGLTEGLRPGPERRARVMPAALLASVIRAVLTHDGILPEQITTDTADLLIADSAEVLTALRVQPGGDGSLDTWPVVAEIVDAKPLPVPYEPDSYGGWDRWGQQ